MSKRPDVDVIVVGAGVLGVTLAYWLCSLYDCVILLVDSEAEAGMHTSSRNTGVVHRPFYLDPRKKRVFAATSLRSHPMWKSLADSAHLPWSPIGTFIIALDEHEAATLEEYNRWGVENGMEENELELLDGRSVKSLEPEVICNSALLSRTDVSVDFGAFTRYLWRYLLSKGVRYLGGHKVVKAKRRDDGYEVEFNSSAGRISKSCSTMINAAGGGALAIAHGCGLAKAYASLNFRGEYWVVDEPFASRVRSNIYRPPRFPNYPFLDPHFVVRADGTRQIGPNAVLVPGPYVYGWSGLTGFRSFLDRPVVPKARLISNRDFLSLVAGEWRSSLSKKYMCERVRKFIPSLESNMLNGRGISGIRSSVVDPEGFVPESLLILDESSAHIINFNSPGATGAPSFSAMTVSRLRSSGLLRGLKERVVEQHIPGWDFNVAASPEPLARYS